MATMILAVGLKMAPGLMVQGLQGFIGSLWQV